MELVILRVMKIKIEVELIRHIRSNLVQRSKKWH